MNKINVITIDGPSASGKGFLARKIAKTYRLNILDSGALYRLFAFFVERGHEVNKVSQKIQRDVEFINENEDLTDFFKPGNKKSSLVKILLYKNSLDFSHPAFRSYGVFWIIIDAVVIFFGAKSSSIILGNKISKQGSSGSSLYFEGLNFSST